MVLEKIEQANDIKKLNPQELEILAGEIREFLIEKISKTGGHLASNLGVVELTMALHLAFQLPEDKIIWDVGHQSYTHKILTGRREGFEGLRKYGGMSGFPKRRESDCDAFGTGHSSTSISAGLGYAHARDIRKKNYKVVSVIGDGALTGGMAFEALNNATRLEKNFIIVLNDNNMSISENVGGLSNHLNRLRTAESYHDLKEGVMNSLAKIPVYGDWMVEQVRRAKSGIKQLVIPGMIYENMGITYLGPVDGHNIEEMVRVFKDASKVDGPVMVHCLTQKGRGYLPAERHPARFHGAEPFDIETGLPSNKKEKAAYTDIFSTVMRKLGDRNENVVAITAAMETGTGLKRFHNMFPERFFDVGIAEEHAITFAAGVYGMIGGQVVDVESEGKEIDADTLKFIHIHKTSALLESAMLIGAVLAGASEQQQRTVELAARELGLAFQIRDDILDVTGNTDELGKPVGSDEKNHKNTYVALEGLEKAKEDVKRYSESAIDRLKSLPVRNEFLYELIEELIDRRS